MKVLLTMNLPYFPGYGGAYKGNRDLLEGLMERGHSAMAVVPAMGVPSSLTQKELLAGLAASGMAPLVDGDAIRFVRNQVEVKAALEPSRLRNHLTDQIRKFSPDWVLVSSEDPSQTLLDAALETCPTRTIYLARTTSMLPCGPQAFFPNRRGAQALERARAIVSISRFVSDYIRRWTGLKSPVLPLSFFGKGPWPQQGSFDRRYVTMVNPCGVKGLSIFLGLARTLPDVPFAAVPTWGATEADRAALAELGNVTIIPAAENIDEIFAQTRVLLVPSLMAEAWPSVIVEAMVRGIPVLASNLGGNPETKLPSRMLLAVKPIERYSEELDGNLRPPSEIPQQDLAPWLTSLTALVDDRRLFAAASAEVRAAGIELAGQMHAGPMEEFLRRMLEPAPSQTAPNGNGLSAALAKLTPKQRTLLSLRVNRRAEAAGPAEKRISRIPRAGRDAPLPASYQQRRVWLVEQINPGMPFHNVHVALACEGVLNVPAMERALSEVVQRHEILRTTFRTTNGVPEQLVGEPVPVRLRLVDLSGLPAAEGREQAKALAAKYVRLPFDLSCGPLYRFEVLRLSEREHVLVLAMHHIICDGWSMSVLAAEVAAIYSTILDGQSRPPGELPIQYGDFAHWQGERMRQPALTDQLNYWRRQLAGTPAVLDLATGHPRPAVRNMRGARVWFETAPELSEQIRRLCRSEGVTPCMVWLAGFAVLLGRYSGEDDVVIGVPVAGRGQAETQDLIGLFMNPLAVRVRLNAKPTFKELLQQVCDTLTEALANQELPFEKVVEDLQPERNPGYSPVFQVMFRFDENPLRSIGLPGAKLRPLEVDNGAVDLDLSASISELDGKFAGSLAWSTDLFDEGTVVHMTEHWRNLLAAMAANLDQRIGDAPLLSIRERQEILIDWNRTATDYGPEVCLHQLVEEQAECTPRATALVFENREMSYADLNQAANRLARYLRSRGVGPESVVGVCLPRGLELPVALLAILKAGGAWLPLEPEFPRDRLNLMAADAGIRLLITNEPCRHLAPEVEHVFSFALDWEGAAAYSPANLANSALPGNKAYVIFTSGSTGNPKGAVNTHCGIVNRLRWMQEEYRLSPADRVLQKTPFSFDVSVWEFFWPLMTGASMVLARPGGHRDIPYLIDLIVRERITTIHFVPSVLDQFLRAGDLGRCWPLKRVICSGEELTAALRHRFHQKMQTQLINLYGPTEASVDVTAWRCDASAEDRVVPIGRPIANTRIHILDAELQAVPAGVPGELYIGGVGLGRGYLNRAALTAQRFIPDPYSAVPGERLYRTGDQARYRADGAIEFLGRLDDQVKVLGVRIELGEIEAAVQSHPAVSRAVVIASRQASSQLRLTAYVVFRSADPPSWPELRQFLRAMLPDHMIPSTWMRLEELPLTVSGKLNRRALPAPLDSFSEPDRVCTPPRDALELKLAGIWGRLLGVDNIGMGDDFFLLGGHSMLAVQLLSEIRQACGRTISLAAFFGGPSIGQVACLLRQQSARQASRSLVTMQPRGSMPPFFAVHAASGSALCYYDLARHMGFNQPFYALQSVGLDGVHEPLTTIQDMAGHYIEEMRAVAPVGPYRLGGWSIGGLVAFEIAQQLVAQGERIESLALIDARAHASGSLETDDGALMAHAFASEGVPASQDILRSLDTQELWEYALNVVKTERRLPADAGVAEFRRYFQVYKCNVEASRSYVPRPYGGRITLFRAAQSAQPESDPTLGWLPLASAGVETIEVPGNHHSMVKDPHVRVLAENLSAVLAKCSRDLAVEAA